MVNYSCDKCLKTFAQKSHFVQHQNRKNLCENIADKVNQLVENKIHAMITSDKIEIPPPAVSVSNNISKMEHKQSKGLKRNTIDKYYTKGAAVDLCINLIKTHIQIRRDDLIIEPSAGNGSFIPGIKSLSQNNVFYDLEPENAEIIQQDYLQHDFGELRSKHEKIHVIGNPPFGRQSSFAIKFIKKSCEFCSSISFILPKSFKKESLKKTFPPNFHLMLETDLPEKSFLVDGVEYDVPCVFQIWEKKTHVRAAVDKLEPVNFIFVEKTGNPDISFRRVGVNAGTIDAKIDEKSVQSHYFIKFTNNKPTQENMRILSAITYDFNNTVGPKSISKQELIHKFNPLLHT